MSEKYYIESAGGTYGPADVDQLIQWVSEGRIAPETVLVNAQTGARVAAALHPELRSWLNAATQPEPPPVPPSRYDVPGVRSYDAPGGMAQAYRPQPPAPGTQAYYGQAPVQPFRRDQRDQNDSGTGSMAQLPYSLQNVNWGGFFLPLPWALANNTWLGLLCLVPGVGWIVPFLLLFKGNEWAWQNRRFQNEAHFEAVQRAWAAWGLGLMVALPLLVFVLFMLMIGTNP